MRSAVLTVLVLTSMAFGTVLVAPPAEAQAAPPFPQCALPLDVMFIFDTTGSMGGVINDAKNGATAVMNAVAAQVPDVRFGAANYKDYPGTFSYPGYTDVYGGFGDYPWQLNQPLTTNTAAVQAAINGLSAAGGADLPEAFSRAVHESRALAWRPAAVKVVVLFADAPPHDLDFNGQNFGGDPGPDGIAQTADDIDFETVASQVASDGLRYIGVGSGGNAGAAALQHLASTTQGAYAVLGADFVSQITDLILALAPRPVVGARGVGVHAELSVPANPVLDVAAVQVAARGSSGGGVDQAHMVDLPLPLLNGYVSAIDTTAQDSLVPGDARSRANTTIAEVSLLGGAVYARGLHAVVDSRTLPGSSVTSTAGSLFSEVIVNGNPLPQPILPNTIVPLPGVGVLVLHEVVQANTANQASEAVVNMLHLVVDTAQVRGEVVVGRAYAGTTCGPALGGVLATRDNDAGSGGDAPNEPQNAMLLSSPSVVQGRMHTGDDVDYYAVTASPGSKVTAVLVPSTRAKVQVHPLPTEPVAVADLVDADLRLLEPGTFVVREESVLPLAAPERVELNVDKAGAWVLQVRRANTLPMNYTLAVAVTPILLLSQNDALSGGDASDTCAAAVPVSPGLHVGVLRDADYQDWYTFQARIGDLTAVTLKPTEDADGADFDLYLYDAACRFLAASVMGKGVVPKGTPDAIPLLPTQFTSSYRAQVVRYNGIGNYYLHIGVQDPMPTLGPLDVEASGDAGSSQGTATMVSAPVVAQGRFLDGDLQDWYAFPVTSTDKRIVAAVAPSLLSDVRVSLLRPDGSVAAAEAVEQAVPKAVSADVDQVGTWYLRIQRISGGGDYLFTIGTSRV